MTLPQTVAQLTALPEHFCEAAAHAGDPRCRESAVALTLVVAKAFGHLIRGGHLQLDQATHLFDELCAEVAVRRTP